MNHEQTLSIIIPTKDRFGHLRKCVKSILNQSALPDEIIIVDGSIEKALSEEIRDLFSKKQSYLLKYIKTAPCANRQRNIGTNKSQSDLLTFLDDDTVLDKNYIYHVKEFFNKHKNNNDIGALSCKILNPDLSGKKSTKISIGNIISKIFMLWCQGDGKFQLSGIPTLIDPNYDEIREIEFLYAGNSTIPRNIFNEFKFDENLPCRSQLDDDDIAYRISRKYQNYWTPQAFLYHKSHYINNDRSFKSKSFIINHFYLKNKNHTKKAKNRAAFYWSVIGKIVLELYISIRIKNLTGLVGTVSGLKDILIYQKHKQSNR